MQELFPIAMGLVVGGAIGLLRPSLRLPIGVALAVLVGTVATLVTGEFEVSWGFLLIDIPLVACSAALAHRVIRGLRPMPFSR